MERSQSLLGVGIYTVPEAARMTGVSPSRIYRWLRGYRFRVGQETHESPPVWTSDLPEINGSLALSFRDLMEVRFVEFFIGKGVSWKVLREAAGYAAREIGSGHPFSTAKFKTDGKRIFADFMMERRRSLLDIVAQQYTLPTVIDSYLYEGVVFHGGDPARWFPFRNSKKIVIDPAISFGQPTLHPEAVPTSVLAKAFAVEKSIERVSKWYSVPSSSVRTAVEYEQQLAA